MSQRKAVTRKKALAYRRAGKAEKGQILNELVELTGWHRDYARSALRDALALKPVAPRKPRRSIYGAALLPALIMCWTLSRGPSGKRLAPMLRVMVPMWRRDGDLVIDDSDAALLVQMSPATIDRLLKPERKRLELRGKSHTKPGSLLKSQIPIRTWSDWDEKKPGFIEIDLVGHEGGNATGEHAYTLTATDVFTGWTVNRSIKNKAAIWVREALDYVIARFPFPILGIDSDNGSEFINAHFLQYCIDNKLTFTRGRSGNSNDGCYVEQKNWTHVRELVGYLRYDTDAELELLNAIWEHNAYYTNYFQAQQKLKSKQREGAKVKKKYYKAQSPYQRVIAIKEMPAENKNSMTATMNTLKPGQLFKDIEQLRSKLENKALLKAPAPIKPPVNRAFNEPKKRRFLNEATN